ncbi:sensor histidine kinase [Aquimarina amphilecti]|nr:histidine kinase [Aquimarina amphilecti]
MNNYKRFFFQIILWGIIWFFLSFGQRNNEKFLIENSILFMFQIGLIALLVFYTAKQFLFKKKYLLFFLISFSIICASALSSSTISSNLSVRLLPPPKNPRLLERPRKKPPRKIKPPSILMVHFSNLIIAYLVATFIETFLFAQKKEEEMIRNKNENLQTELKLLKSQINPHFLFNSLNNIYALSVIDSDKTQQSISYLSDMLRYVLYECDRPFVSIQKEITYIKNYIKLFSLKNSKPYEITTQFNVDDNSVLIAPMLFIPFIENAFKHSNIEKPGSFIKIKVISDTADINFEIVNSIPKEKIEKDKIGGIGLENVKKRLSILYQEKHQLMITTDNNNFTVKLNIKLDDHA